MAPATETFNPNTKAVRPIVGLLGGIAAVGGILTAVGIGSAQTSGRMMGISLTMLLAGGFCFGFLLLWLRNSRLLAGGGMVGYQDTLGRRHTWTSSEIGAVVRAEIVYPASSMSRPAIYVLGTDGRRLMAFAVMAWSPAALDRLVRESGKNLRTLEKPISAAYFRREYPHALVWTAVHPWLAGGLLTVGVTVLVIAAILIIVR